VKSIALLLGIGGVAGFGICVWTYFQLFEANSLFSKAGALMGVFLVVFGWSAWVGLDLWRRKRQATKWAIVLLALQVPTITVPGFAYQFYTGLTAGPLFNFTEGNFNFNFEIASAIVFQISHKVQDAIFGLNIVAMAALIYLLYLGKDALSGSKSLANEHFLVPTASSSKGDS
jgi:hypothetical protein